ncbi:hypothetical protein MJO28_012574 [Puccinia striiformis f. sp. tritici]|uniref:Uncharacterized protein n=1 Tax=Puccinia striiformis f. sp. tritici TaxID=168172 RepID=A0ACC0E0V6_9BASI|nr:hypothetical protein MJO28_012574 [Puccinia striiformis f. sp. tritici]
MPSERRVATRTPEASTAVAASEDQIVEKLIADVYGDLSGDWSATSGRTFDYISERAIFTKTQAMTNMVNRKVFEETRGEGWTSRSEDVYHNKGLSIDDSSGVTFTNPKGAPACEINLKVGMPICLTEDIIMKGGLYRGTRLIVTGVYDGFLKGRIAAGQLKGDEVVVSKKWFMITDSEQNETYFLRFQYPIVAAYSMVFNFFLDEPVEITGVFLGRGLYREFVRSLDQVDMSRCQKLFIGPPGFVQEDADFISSKFNAILTFRACPEV